MKKITQKSIARKLALSESTVSRALANSPLIGQETRRAVLQEARRQGKVSRSNLVALLVPQGMISGYFARVLSLLLDELHFMDYRPVVLCGWELELLDELDFCGAISVYSDNGLEKNWGRYRNIPLVCINTAPNHLERIFSVSSNDGQAMQLLLEHLIRQGHRRIGRIGLGCEPGKEMTFNRQARENHFCRIMDGYDLDTSLSGEVSGGSGSVLKQLQSRGATAVILLDEGLDMEVLHTLHLSGIKVPEDLSVAGWSYPDTGACLLPELTAVEQDFPQLVRRSCDMLHRLLAGENVSKDVLVDYRFIKRFSTAARPQSAFPSGENGIF